MDLGMVLSAAQTLFAALQCKELKDIFSFLGYESDLKDLQDTVNTVRAVLRDAETKELGEEAGLYIEELKDAVYEADDLFDRFVTLAKKKQLIEGGKVSKKVRRFFSRHNPLGFAYTMSQGVKKIRNKLDKIASNHNRFGFSVDPEPMRLRREETCSYVYEANIIGREDDVENIVAGHLVEGSDPQRDVSFLSVVGIGGQGKTALAQLVYNDRRVAKAFPLRIWTCVSDHDQHQLDAVQILRKILVSATGQNHEGSNKESLQKQVREMVNSKKYLLVLDDVWTEKYNEWLKVEEFFLESQSGSWIVVTTRSHETARIIGNGPKYDLQGLSKENSWCLFQKIAFGPEPSATPAYEDLVEIGQEIVQGCAGVPLAIRVAGSLLYGQDKSKWLAFQKTGLSMSEEGQKDIMPLLKFSYYQLGSSLKSCFTYCAMFPKDHEISKTKLIRLWMAQGYIVPSDGQAVEDAAEEYFTILLRRCFFQDIIFDRQLSKIKSFKIHDLMHDLAVNLAGKEICVTNFASDNNMNKKVRHVSYTSHNFAKPPFAMNHIRSCYNVCEWAESPNKMDVSTLKALLSNWMYLRALDLSFTVDMRNFPESIGELLHLRYLDLSYNADLEVLPKSISKLCNLQTLLIRSCFNMRELPIDFTKLVNLRTLEIGNIKIKYLCLGTLPHLKSLTVDALVELEYLIALTVDGLLSFPSLEELEFTHLNKVKGWRDSRVGMKDAQSNSSSMPKLLFPQLKLLNISVCKELKCELVCPKLEYLELEGFNEGLKVNVLRDEEGEAASASSGSPTSFSLLSSCYGLPKLSRITTDNVRWLNRMPRESFQCLWKLRIFCSTHMESLGEAAEVLRGCSSSLRFLHIVGCHNLKGVMYGDLQLLTALEELVIEHCEDFSEGGVIEDGNDLTWPSFRRLKFKLLPNLRYLPSWIQFFSALETLLIQECERLEAMPNWMPKLTSLRQLAIKKCSHRLMQRCQNPNGEDWPLIQHIPSIHFY